MGAPVSVVVPPSFNAAASADASMASPFSRPLNDVKSEQPASTAKAAASNARRILG